MKPILIPVLGLSAALLPALAQAEPFSAKCPDVPTCAQAVGVMLGQKYMIDPTLKGGVMATSNLELTADNAELLFTAMLNEEGLSRVPLGAPNTYQIMRQRDARDAAIPLVECDSKHAPSLPSNYDDMTMRYRASYPEAVENIARTARSFMPANSRIIPEEVSGSLLVTDSAMNLRKLYQILRELDQKPTAEIKARWKADRVAWQQRELEKARACADGPDREGHPHHGPAPAPAAAPQGEPAKK